ASSRAVCITTVGRDRSAAAHGSSPPPAPPPRVPAAGTASRPAGGCGPCPLRPLRLRLRPRLRPVPRSPPVSPAVPVRRRGLGCSGLCCSRRCCSPSCRRVLLGPTARGGAGRCRRPAPWWRSSGLPSTATAPAIAASTSPCRPRAGTVRFSGSVAGRGVVSVLHADGLVSTYEPVHGLVEAGTRVGAGEVLGTLESDSTASHCEGGCLHLGARRGGIYLDPLPLLGA